MSAKCESTQKHQFQLLTIVYLFQTDKYLHLPWKSACYSNIQQLSSKTAQNS